MEHLPISLRDISQEWLTILKTPELLKDILPSLETIKDRITPKLENVFEFAKLTPNPYGIKVVILGQDPYPKLGDAHGLAFSCKTGIPMSLKNVFKCMIKSKVMQKMPESGDLTYLSKQGVLLLNTALTTNIGESNSHTKLWNEYTGQLITRISKHNPNAIFLLWGKNAESMKNYINKQNKVLVYSHPSPLSRIPFEDCPHFIQVNKILEELKSEVPSEQSRSAPIIWSESDVPEHLCISNRKLYVFTDGSSSLNGKSKTSAANENSTAGYAVLFPHGCISGIRVYGKLDNSEYFATNQRAEGYAILRALQILTTKDYVNKWDECEIITDSQFWIDMINTYMPAWDSRNKNLFDEKKNPDITKPLWAVYNKYQCEKSITFRHINSHTTAWKKMDTNSFDYFCYSNNDAVDALAEKGKLENEAAAEKIIQI